MIDSLHNFHGSVQFANILDTPNLILTNSDFYYFHLSIFFINIYINNCYKSLFSALVPMIMFNCSQTMIVAIVLVLSVSFYEIFRLTDFSSDSFEFSSSKTG